jgi:hypothetical protein
MSGGTGAADAPPPLPPGWRAITLLKLVGPKGSDGLAPNLVIEGEPARRGQTEEELLADRKAHIAVAEQLELVEEGELLFLSRRRPFLRYTFRVGELEVSQTLTAALHGGSAYTAVATCPVARHGAEREQLRALIAGFSAPA